MATILRLRNAIESKRQKSTTGQRFIAIADQEAIFTGEEIRNVVEELKLSEEQKVGLVRSILDERGITVLAILVWMNEQKSIIKFRQHSALNSTRLPLSESDAIRIAPKFGRRFASEVQWEFIPYIFDNRMCEARRTINEARILPFVQEESLGEGAFGAVYKMTLPSSQHRFKLDSGVVQNQSSIVRKRIKFHTTTSAIEQELRCLILLHGLRHPNIVPFLGLYDFKNEYNFLFPCFDMDLNEMLKREDRFENFEWDFTFFAALSGLASAMENLHDLQLTPAANDVDLAAKGYHHDFRPANILVNRETFFLTDFGLSKLKPEDQTSQTTWSTTMGDYIAPECMAPNFEPQMVGRAIDIWALGCLLFEVATYMEKGPKGLEQFRDKREGPGPLIGWRDRKFCDKDGVRAAVWEWRRCLLDHPKTPFLKDVFKVAESTLEIDPLLRPKAGKINKLLLFPSVKAQFGAMQSAFSDYADLAIQHGNRNTPSMEIWHQKERVHVFGIVLGLEEDNDSLDPRSQDLESIYENLNDLFRMLRSEIRDMKTLKGSGNQKDTLSHSLEHGISIYVQLLWRQVPPQLVEKMEIELKTREKACLTALLHSEYSRANGSRIISKILESFPKVHLNSNPKYDRWLQTDTSSLLWVLEAQGRGKTGLASFLVEELTRRSQSCKNTVPVVTQVFCGVRSIDKKDATWILGNVIHQLVLNDKLLTWKHALPAYQKRYRKYPIWTFEAISQLFNGVMRDIQGPVYLVIDLFDESDTMSQGLLLDTFRPFLCHECPALLFKVIIISKQYAAPIKDLQGFSQMKMRWGEVYGKEGDKDEGYSEVNKEFMVIKKPEGRKNDDYIRESDTTDMLDTNESEDDNRDHELARGGPLLFIPQRTSTTRRVFTPPHRRNSITACSWTEWNCRVYFQDSLNHIKEAISTQGNWSIMAGHMGIGDAKVCTPLAVCTRFNDDEREIRLYYLTPKNIIHEQCYLKQCGWFAGTLNKHNVLTAGDSYLAVASWSSGIYVYYQSANGAIEKYCHVDERDDWVKGEQIVDAEGKPLALATTGSSLAVVTYLDNRGRSIHLYFQGMDSKVKEVVEYIQNGSTVYRSGSLPQTKAPDRIPLTAVAWNRNSPKICLYWQSKAGQFCESMGPKNWILYTDRIPKSLMGENNVDLAAVQWGSGSHRDIYKISNRDTIEELSWEDGKWVLGEKIE